MRSASSWISWQSSRSFSDGALLQQLRRAADAGQRVLHLMRQHRRHGRGAARRAEEVQLPVRASARSSRPAGSAPRRPAAPAAARHGPDDAAAVQARAFQREVVVGDRRLMLPHLGQQGEQPAVLAAAGRASAHAPRGRRGEAGRTARPPGWRSGSGSRHPAPPPAAAARARIAARIRQRRGAAAARRGARRRRCRAAGDGAAHAAIRSGIGASGVEAARAASSPWSSSGSVEARRSAPPPRPRRRAWLILGAELGRAGQALGVPGDVLAREAHARSACRDATACRGNARAGSPAARPAPARPARWPVARYSATWRGNQGRP